MSDVDKLQVAEEAAAQRAEAAAQRRRERDVEALRAEPVRPTALKLRAPQVLPLAQVHPGDNVRPDLPDVTELARSIREVGLLSPLLVRPWDTSADADGALPDHCDAAVPQYRLVAGHRRHAALHALHDAGVEGYDSVPCEVREGLTEAEAFALMLTENVQRVALEPVQAARALRLLLDLNEGMSAAELARSLGLRPAWAQTHLKLLDLPQEVQDRLEAGDLSVTIADLLRRGQAAGRIDASAAVDIAAKVASGEITTAQARAAAGPPPSPNTQAPRTVEAGPDGRPLEGGDYGQSLPRPATPLTAPSPPQQLDPSYVGPSAAPLPRVHGEAAAQLARSPREAVDVVPYEDRLDAYLLGRALREWASDDYLDELGIDRVQGDAYAALLGFEERVAAIRHLSAALMESEPALVGAR